MTKMAIADYFPKGFPVKVDDIEIQNGPSIPTYFLMKDLEKKYAGQNMSFYFIMGSDLVPDLIKWDNGQEMIDEVNYILFERKGFEYILDENVEKTF